MIRDIAFCLLFLVWMLVIVGRLDKIIALLTPDDSDGGRIGKPLTPVQITEPGYCDLPEHKGVWHVFMSNCQNWMASEPFAHGGRVVQPFARCPTCFSPDPATAYPYDQHRTVCNNNFHNRVNA